MSFSLKREGINMTPYEREGLENVRRWDYQSFAISICRAVCMIIAVGFAGATLGLAVRWLLGGG